MASVVRMIQTKAAGTSSGNWGTGLNTKLLNREPLDKHYELGLELGSGAFSVVRVAKHRATNTQYAVKIIMKKPHAAQIRKQMEEVEAEVNIVEIIQGSSNQRHPHIIWLKEVFETSQAFNIIMEFVPGGDLYDLIALKRHIPENETRLISFHIALGLKHLHSKRIVHRDIKPENILLTVRGDGLASITKICDLGTCKVLDKTPELFTCIGSLGYTAPEVLAVRNWQLGMQGYGLPVDLWSFGIVVYFMLAGITPFYTESEELTNTLSERGQYSFHERDGWGQVSSTVKDFISRLLVVDPRARMTIDQALNHPWLRDLYQQGQQRTEAPPPLPAKPSPALPTPAPAHPTPNAALLALPPRPNNPPPPPPSTSPPSAVDSPSSGKWKVSSPTPEGSSPTSASRPKTSVLVSDEALTEEEKRRAVVVPGQNSTFDLFVWQERIGNLSGDLMMQIQRQSGMSMLSFVTGASPVLESRWLVLHDSNLVVYVQKPTQQTTTLDVLENIDDIIPLDSIQMVSPVNACTFSLRTNGHPELLFHTQSEEESQMWICGIYKAINNYFQSRDPNFNGAALSQELEMEKRVFREQSREGYLLHLPLKGGWKWKKRWFVLRCGFLLMYKSRSDAPSLGQSSSSNHGSSSPPAASSPSCSFVAPASPEPQSYKPKEKGLASLSSSSLSNLTASLSVSASSSTKNKILHRMPLYDCEVEDYFPNKFFGSAIQVRNIREQIVLRKCPDQSEDEMAYWSNAILFHKVFVETTVNSFRG